MPSNTELTSHLNDMYTLLMRRKESSKALLPIWMGCEAQSRSERLAYWNQAIENGVEPWVVAKVALNWTLKSMEAKQDLCSLLPPDDLNRFLLAYCHRDNHQAETEMMDAFILSGLDLNVNLALTNGSKVPLVGLLIGNRHWDDAKTCWENMRQPITHEDANLIAWQLFRGLYQDALRIEDLHRFSQPENHEEKAKMVAYRVTLLHTWMERLAPFHPDFSFGMDVSQDDRQGFHMAAGESTLSTWLHLFGRFCDATLQTSNLHQGMVREEICKAVLPYFEKMDWSKVLWGHETLHPAVVYFLKSWGDERHSHAANAFQKTCAERLISQIQAPLEMWKPCGLLQRLLKANLKTASIQVVLEGINTLPVKTWTDAKALFTLMVEPSHQRIFFGEDESNEAIQPLRKTLKHLVHPDLQDAWMAQLQHVDSLLARPDREAQEGIRLLSQTWGEEPPKAKNQGLRL